MPTYQINSRNSFIVNGKTYFVARTRYRDDGMTVFCVENGVAHRVNAFWTCLLTPEYKPLFPKNRSCREQAEKGIQLWNKFNNWLPTPEQLKIIATATRAEFPNLPEHFHNYIHRPEDYEFWFRYFHTNALDPSEGKHKPGYDPAALRGPETANQHPENPFPEEAG